MARRLLRGGHRCVGYNRTREAVESIVKEGGVGASSLEDLVSRLSAPRAVWLMLPAGEATESAVQALGAMLSAGDVIVDGGNTHYVDDVRRARALAEKGVRYVDVGTSGGVWGLERGYSLMIGGDGEAVRLLTPIFETLAPGMGTIPRTPGASGSAEKGYLHCGPAGAGHFVKMVHNGIEYGLMQAYAEGLAVLRGAPEGYRFDLAAVSEVWRRGSVIGSWLLDLTAAALAKDPELAAFSGYVEDSGEGRWTIRAAIEQGVPVPVMTAALYARFRSREKDSFSDKALSAMRRQFGGHVERPPK